MSVKKKVGSSVTPGQARNRRAAVSGLCVECKGNEAEYQLMNGEEITRLCKPCLEEMLVDLVLSNDTITFQTTQRKKRGAMQAYAEIV